jgi:serine/threonine protein kinase
VIGQTISHYKILDKLGEGGMGVVYKAEDTKLERTVALKFLPAHLLGDEEVKKRFKREAKAAAALDHSNVCTVYEIDEADHKTFISMALIEGESLDKRIESGPLKLEDALDIAQQIAKGLEAAHNKGVVHRDIKPQNIMVADDGHVTIMDFGLAQLTQASLLTRPDQTMGTTFYMSPEQTEGSGTDHRTDIWALGVVIYEMITGQRPFKGDYDKAVMYSILNEEPGPLIALRTGVPMGLEVTLNKALAKSAEDRYQSVGEFAVDLRVVKFVMFGRKVWILWWISIVSQISFVIYKLAKLVRSWTQLGNRKWPVLAGSGRSSLESRKPKRGAPRVLIPRYQRRCAVSATATPGCLVVFPRGQPGSKPRFGARFRGAGWVVTSFAIARQSP